MARIRAMEREELHGPWPTLIEQVEAAYPDWEISRDRRSDGTHGHWRARRDKEEVAAPTPDELYRRLTESRDSGHA